MIIHIGDISRFLPQAVLRTIPKLDIDPAFVERARMPPDRAMAGPPDDIDAAIAGLELSLAEWRALNHRRLT